MFKVSLVALMLLSLEQITPPLLLLMASSTVLLVLPLLLLSPSPASD
jgi:hypothetical protein